MRVALGAMILFVAGAGSAQAFPKPAIPGSTNCRVKVENAVVDGLGWRTNGVVQPAAKLSGIGDPAARGQMTVHLADGRSMTLNADTLRCRRDGGRVPPHGGANIADIAGTGVYQHEDHGPMKVTFRSHVEDRGEGEFNTEDYIAVSVRDPGTGEEIFFDANFLVSGTVKLIPA